MTSEAPPGTVGHRLGSAVRYRAVTSSEGAGIAFLSSAGTKQTIRCGLLIRNSAALSLGQAFDEELLGASSARPSPPAFLRHATFGNSNVTGNWVRTRCSPI